MSYLAVKSAYIKVMMICLKIIVNKKESVINNFCAYNNHNKISFQNQVSNAYYRLIAKITFQIDFLYEKECPWENSSSKL